MPELPAVQVLNISKKGKKGELVTGSEMLDTLLLAPLTHTLCTTSWREQMHEVLRH